MSKKQELIIKMKFLARNPNYKKDEYCYKIKDGITSTYLTSSEMRELIKQYKKLAKSRR